MTAPRPETPAPPNAPDGETAMRIAQLFRRARGAGVIHPLQHLIERYRAEQQATKASR